MIGVIHHLKSFIKKFHYAFMGLKINFKQERSFRFHIVVSIYTIILAFFMGFTGMEYALLFLTIGFVIAMEIFNTALETVVDLITSKQHPLAKIAKDVSSAAVFVSALSSVLIGLFLFWKPSRLFLILTYMKSHVIVLLLLFFSFIASFFFVLINPNE